PASADYGVQPRRGSNESPSVDGLQQASSERTAGRENHTCVAQRAWVGENFRAAQSASNGRCRNSSASASISRSQSADHGIVGIALAQLPVGVAALDGLELSQLRHRVLMLLPGGIELQSQIDDGGQQVCAAQ